ncbi:hypothetical protein LRP52_32250 [Photobacterium sp. ZSDE20]|uniref:Phospholipase D-like domain-containing protein n=1 Tax=Photobacterium pectinilyticum TaxID=2906793 RepID=A0ABT1N640_9GAMM|nr:hypothetical protein [Photobacterium sp. ZSDE20]MCQ1060002.1 hypothetical protein [Photobacterium sp. ZSDE20]MDD1826860.1 hypothetical protein [Photobacterium sp. ZSDE20]
MIPHKKKHYKGKCPHCQNIIEFHSVHFNLDSDNGEIISNCDSCNEKFKIVTINPDESYIVYGARKESYVDYDIHSASKFPEIQGIINFEGSLNDQKMIFDSKAKPIYLCNDCDKSLEEIAFHKLDNAFSEIIMAYSDYTTIDIKGYGFNPQKAIFLLNIKCTCNKEYSAVFYKKYDHKGYDISDFNLGNIINSKPLESVIDGTMSKDDCMELLKKTLVRWELLFDKVLIITPFVGHQYLSDEKLIDTWFSILSQISKDKAKLITRTASLNKVKKAISDNIHDYNELEEYHLSVTQIDEATKLQASHAKIYCGFSHKHCEIIHGSANIVYGPSKEQITFKSYGTYEELYNKFLHQLGAKGLDLNEYPNNCGKTSNVIFDESMNFKAKQILNEDFEKLLL